MLSASHRTQPLGTAAESLLLAKRVEDVAHTDVEV
jgi:hypothetical protein